MNTAYIICKVTTGKMVDNKPFGSAFEGEDGKARAEDIVQYHNTQYPNNQWYVSEEVL